jgi:hypothetical protein
MGWGHVNRLVAYGGLASLTPNEYKVALMMSTRALDAATDTNPADHYWAGWEELAVGIGLDLPPKIKGDRANKDRRDKLHETVRVACRGLEKKGWISGTVDHPLAGSRQVYRLHFPRLPLPPDDKGAEAPNVKGATAPGSIGAQPPDDKGA